jgi:hypothetical protein
MWIKRESPDRWFIGLGIFLSDRYHRWKKRETNMKKRVSILAGVAVLANKTIWEEGNETIDDEEIRDVCHRSDPVDRVIAFRIRNGTFAEQKSNCFSGFWHNLPFCPGGRHQRTGNGPKGLSGSDGTNRIYL